MHPARVLVVDDEPPIRGLVAKILERAGLAVETAVDGEEAIEKMQATQYDVVMVDLMMPRVDGFGVVDFVKRMRGRRPALIVATAGDSGTIRKLDGAVVHSVLRKPFDIEVLADLISAAADSVRGQSEERDDSVVPFRKPSDPHR